MVDLAYIAVFTRRNMRLPTIPDDHVLTEMELERPYMRALKRRKFIYGVGK